MYLITDGGPFALFVVAWGVVMVPLLALETRRAPVWFPGLHAGLLAVLFGLGATGWLMGVENVVEAVINASQENKLRLAALGNTIAPYPFILSGVLGAMAAPWMLWNANKRSETQLVPAPLIRAFTWATGLCVGLSLFLAIPIFSWVLQGALLSRAFPIEQLLVARWLAVIAIPMGLLNIALALAGAHRHQRARQSEQPVVAGQAQRRRAPEPVPNFR